MHDYGFAISVIAAIVMLGVLIKEILIAIEIGNTFKCPNCKKHIDKILNLRPLCPRCSCTDKIQEHTWRHFFTHRINYIKEKPKNAVHCYTSYIKYSKIEISIAIICLIVLIANIVFQLAITE